MSQDHVSAAEFARLHATLTHAHTFFQRTIAGWPSDKLTFQLSPFDNHVLWTLGHIASANHWFAGMLDGTTWEMPEAMKPVFSYDSKPVPDATKYPSLDVCLELHASSFARLESAMKAASLADLTLGPAIDSHGFVASRFEVPSRAVWHYGWHTGQLSTLRRALGLTSVFA